METFQKMKAGGAKVFLTHANSSMNDYTRSVNP
jgi:hypothetical protein